MSATAQFWWGWSVNALVAIGTIGAVLVALRLHIRVIPPQLRLALRTPDGEATITTLTTTAPDGTVTKQRPEAARYYHVVLSNDRPWIPATEVGVFLVSVEMADASGAFADVWAGALPVVATHYGIHPSRTLGAAPQEYDLCNVVKDKWLELEPFIVPNNFPHRHRNTEAPIRLRVTLQARSLEAVSKRFRFELSWDGKWEDDTAKMRRHVVVRQL